MDLTKGYYAVRIKEEHIYKTAWSIPGLGAYEFVRLPLGLKTAQVIFANFLIASSGDWIITNVLSTWTTS